MRLTYGILLDTLTGLNNFRLFYPHLDFMYHIFVHPSDEDEHEVGMGLLGLVVIGPT